MTQVLTPLRVAEVLRRAEALIGERGWWHLGIQPQMHEERPRLCLMESVHQALLEMEPGVALDAYAQIHDLLAARLRLKDFEGGPQSCVQWNDLPRRTETEVRALLRMTMQDIAWDPNSYTHKREGE